MEDEHESASCDDYLARAAEEHDIDRLNELLEKAFAADPDRKEEILRVAVELISKRIWERRHGHNQKNGSSSAHKK